LDGENVGFFEESFGDFSEACFTSGFLNVPRKTRVRRFNDHGFAEFVEDFGDFFVVQFIFVQENCGYAWDIVLFE